MLTNQCDIIEGQICGFGIAAESSVGVSDVRSSILDLLRPLGITERYFGVRQLIQAVEMVMENPDTIHALQKDRQHIFELLFITARQHISATLRMEKLVSHWNCYSKSVFFWEKVWTTSLWTIPVLTHK